MKTILHILICLIILGCNTSSDKKKDNIDIKIDKTEYVKTSSAHFGFWVYEEYLKALQQTNSTKKASQMGVDDFYKITKNNSVTRLNLHDGGAENILLMTTKSTGQIFSSDTLEAYFKIEFKDNYLVIKNRKYIKAPHMENGLRELVNKTLFSGEYIIDDKIIKFQDSGKIVGLDSILNYKANLDYADAGMQYDKIYLKFNKEEELRIYLYEFVSDTLVIFSLDCLNMDEEFDYCLEVEKGAEFMRLTKKK